ncbi:MAG TPA: hemerythrin domain-containing protein [Polyangiaceae bacterium]|jgi:hemerythrin superfamily protein|nr:hemerythrin domain-containing protein [Polyangiaceae bacterium]
MNATRILISQHRAIEALFVEVARETRPQARARAASRLTEELIAHMAGEEAIFYPAARRALGRLAANGEGGIDDHFMLRAQLRRFLATNVREPSFQPRFEALRLLFTRHVQDEESELFPRVEATLARAQLDALGARVLGARPPIWLVSGDQDTVIYPDMGSLSLGLRLPSLSQN